MMELLDMRLSCLVHEGNDGVGRAEVDTDMLHQKNQDHSLEDDGALTGMLGTVLFDLGCYPLQTAPISGVCC